MQLSENPDGSYKVMCSCYNAPCWRQCSPVFPQPKVSSQCTFMPSARETLHKPHLRVRYSCPGKRVFEVPYRTTESCNHVLRPGTHQSQSADPSLFHHWLLRFKLTSGQEQNISVPDCQTLPLEVQRAYIFHAHGPA